MKIHPFNQTSSVFIDASKHCLAAFINSNHGSDKECNVEFVEKSFDDPSTVDFINIVSVVAIKEISIDEELLINYGSKFSFTEDELEFKVISIKSSEERVEKEKRRKEIILSKNSNFINLCQR